jgi:hypothetical protein
VFFINKKRRKEGGKKKGREKREGGRTPHPLPETETLNNGSQFLKSYCDPQVQGKNTQAGRLSCTFRIS